MIYALAILSLLITLFSVIPFIRAPHGLIRILAFPRQQYLFLAVPLLIAVLLVLSGPTRFIAAALLLISIVVNLAYILPYTPLWPKQSLDADADLASATDRHVSLMTANVKLSNRDFGRLAELVRENDPDVLMLIEVDQDWLEALPGVRSAFSHHVDVPMDNGYGMALWSRLPLSDVGVDETLVNKVPTIGAKVTLGSGDMVLLHVVHPEPPMPNHTTDGRDGEIGKVAEMVSNEDLPVIVSGDLNDVAWSMTTRRFQRVSGLLDPRIGRGFYNTFHAAFPVMRWPLDHLFHDARFRLIEVERLRPFGSDHFAMVFKLALSTTTASGVDVEEVKSRDIEEIEDSVEVESGNNRTALGSDWEKPQK